MIKKLLGLLVVIILILVAIWGYHYYETIHKSSSQAATKPQPTTVELTVAKQKIWPEQIITTGEITSVDGLILRAEIPGRVTKILIHSGERVKKGQELFQINPAVLKAALEAIEANLQLDKLTLEQQQQIFKKGYGSKLLLDTAQSKYLATLEKVKRARAALDLSIVRAPVNGLLGLKLVKLGDYVKQGDPLIPLEVKTALRVDFSVPSFYLIRLLPGQKVLVQTKALPNRTFTAKIFAINSKVNSETRSIGVRALLTDCDGSCNRQVLSGLFGVVRVNLRENRKVTIVPQTSVIYDISGSYIYVVKNGIAKKTIVKTGERRGDLVSILSGVKPGDLVVSAGQNKLKDGSPVTGSKKEREQ